MIERARKSEYQRKATGRMIPCSGEAHSNPFIDHCMQCAPRWGTVPEYAPVDLDDARKRKVDVRVVDLPHEQVSQLEQSGEVKLVMVRRRLSGGGSVSYFVARWVKP